MRRSWEVTAVEAEAETDKGEAAEMSWSGVIEAAQETSFAFLKDEPNLYSDEDGEPL